MFTTYILLHISDHETISPVGQNQNGRMALRALWASMGAAVDDRDANDLPEVQKSVLESAAEKAEGVNRLGQSENEQLPDGR